MIPQSLHRLQESADGRCLSSSCSSVENSKPETKIGRFAEERVRDIILCLTNSMLGICQQRCNFNVNVC